MSLNDPPTNEIFFDVSVIKVRLPLWDEQPNKPNLRYHPENIFTTICDVVNGDLSVRTTKEVSMLKERYVLRW